ncbi:protein RETARDED ROOT GROWTH-LIKE isoform X2 [Lathyrus oleraceus]|uniref:protein RETARDED ROOT GROWTH-LIKE isoform X2 n=1 Tax=Pisum sativum TaxID=3888 RepID=UPI001FC4E9AC|nr:protein RETARDED ROOT GROWTH-LIKE isoform X2 [Pisum sativum]
MLRSLDTTHLTHLTLRTTLLLRSFLSSPSSFSSHSSPAFKTITTLSQSKSYSFPSLSSTKQHASSFTLPLFRSSVIRCVSSFPTLHLNDAVSCSELDAHAHAHADSTHDGTFDQDTKAAIPVRAFFFSTSVDLKTLVEQNKPNFVTPSSRMTNYVVLKFGNLGDSKGPGSSFLNGTNGCYMVVFQYGSIVLFNVCEHEVDGYLKIVRKHASGLLPEMRKDEYEVREKSALSTWMLGGLDYIMLQYLDVDGIRTIGSVLGQSIALDYYGRQVDGMVAEFTDINREMEATGKFKMQRKKLFQLVGKANSNLADVILKLGLFERTLSSKKFTGGNPYPLS